MFRNYLYITYTYYILVGEWINLDMRMEQFGQWLKQKTGNAKDRLFVDGFVTASLTVCIGAMAIFVAVAWAFLPF